MNLSQISFVLAAAFSSSALVACTADPSPGVASSASSTNAISYASTSALPSCLASSGLELAYVVETDSFVVCFEGQWRELGGAPRANGEDGKNGAPARPGPRGFRGFDGAKGERGEQGPQGIAGQAGENGHTAFIEVHPEPPGENCTAGGIMVIAGIDYNDNQEMDEGEGTVTYVCHGENGESASPPPSSDD